MASELGVYHTGLNGSAYDSTQLHEYFQRIGLVSSSNDMHESSQRSEKEGKNYYHARYPPTLETLRLLQKHQLCSIPFENVSLHYSIMSAGHISLDTTDLFHKLVRQGRGGYCMENNIFFMHILRALGFEVYCAGARVRRRNAGVPVSGYLGWCHAVIIVTFSTGSSPIGPFSGSSTDPSNRHVGQGENEEAKEEDGEKRYMVDVGFGGDGPISPLPLVHGAIVQNIGAQQIRIEYKSLDSFVNKRQKVWIYEYRNKETDEWRAAYCFVDTEFLLQDFEVINFYTSHAPQSYVTHTLIAVRMLLSEAEVERVGEATVKPTSEVSRATSTSVNEAEDGREIYGKIMIAGGTVKKNTGGRTATLQVCATEQERIKALQEWFGIKLTEEQITGIYGRVAALPREEFLTSH